MRDITPAEVHDRPLVEGPEPAQLRAGAPARARPKPKRAIVAPLDEVPPPAAGICPYGARSANVVAYLEQQGREAVNVAGGTVQWAAEGRPMVGSVV